MDRYDPYTDKFLRDTQYDILGTNLAEVSTDCISRQAAIDFIDAGHLVNPNEPRWSDNEVVNFLKSRPPVQPEQRWIPCSERMPEEYGNYLISIDGEEPDIGTINPNDPRGWSLCDANGFYWASDKALNITAWMPLPESYKVGEQDE